LVANADYIAFMFKPVIELGLEKVLIELKPPSLTEGLIFSQGQIFDNLTRDFVDSLKGCGFYSGGD